MDNVVPFDEPKITFEFNCKKGKQKAIINALWNYSKLDPAQLAFMIDVPFQELQDVHNGGKYLHDEAAKRLALCFLILFGD